MGHQTDRTEKSQFSSTTERSNEQQVSQTEIVVVEPKLTEDENGKGRGKQLLVPLTNDEMANLLRLPVVEIDRMRERGELPFIRVAGQIRFPLGLQKFRIEGGSDDSSYFAATAFFDNQVQDTHIAIPNAYDALDEEEVAELLRVELKTVQFYTRRTKELAYVPVGKKRIILRKDLNAFLDHRRVYSVHEVSLRRKERNS